MKFEIQGYSALYFYEIGKGELKTATTNRYIRALREKCVIFRGIIMTKYENEILKCKITDRH